MFANLLHSFWLGVDERVAEEDAEEFTYACQVRSALDQL